MHEATRALRDHLVRVLDWEDAHVGFDKALAGIPREKQGVRPAGFEHSYLPEELRGRRYYRPTGSGEEQADGGGDR